MEIVLHLAEARFRDATWLEVFWLALSREVLGHAVSGKVTGRVSEPRAEKWLVLSVFGIFFLHPLLGATSLYGLLLIDSVSGPLDFVLDSIELRLLFLPLFFQSLLFRDFFLMLL